MTARALAERGRRLLAAGALRDAHGCFAEAVRLAPESGVDWALLGQCEAMIGGYHAAADTLRRACELAPQAGFAHRWLGHALREQNEPEAARAAFARAATLDPADASAAFGAELTMPVVYRDAQEIAAWRARYAEGLQRLLHHAPQAAWPRSILALEWSNFYLAYQGGHDVALQRGYADLVAGLLGRVVPHWHAPLRARPHRGRRRVAFVSTHLCEHTVADYFGGWIAGLPRDRFEVHAVHAGRRVDARTDALARASDAFVHLPDDARRLAAALRGAELDAIVYPDVGMSPLDSVLANLRLAPVQLAGWGHPVTTGSRFIDAYLSCATMEPPDAPAHYVEPLVRLPGLGVDFRPSVAPASADRAAFRLPGDAHVYVCPQSLCKIHPDSDALLLDVLARDARAVLVFIAARAPGQTNAFVARLASGMSRAGIATRQQVKVLPAMPRDRFLALLAVSDAMLDPPHWSGGHTALDALSVGVPIVTLPGATMRGRQSAAMLAMLGLGDLVARDPADYVARALAIAADPGLRGSLSARIREGLPRIFGRPEPIEALADAIESAHAAAFARGQSPG